MRTDLAVEGIAAPMWCPPRLDAETSNGPVAGLGCARPQPTSAVPAMRHAWLVRRVVRPPWASPHPQTLHARSGIGCSAMSGDVQASLVSVALVAGVLIVATNAVGFVSGDLAALLAAIGVAFASLLSVRRAETAVGRIQKAERKLPAPDVGVLICNAADESTLASVARQVQAEVLPSRSERKRTSGRSGAFSVLFKGLGLGRSSTRGAEDTDVFENTDDTNVLLGRVLRALNDKKALRRDLVRIPGLALEPDDRFEDSQAIARVFEDFVRSQSAQGNVLRADLRVRTTPPSSSRGDGGEKSPARALVINFDKFGEELSGRLGREVPLQRVGDSLRHRWSQLADGTLVLVEGPWEITQTDDGFLLTLTALTVDEGEDLPEGKVDMPVGLAVECRVPTATLLKHRAGRLRDGHHMPLGVFGQVSRRISDEAHTLVLEPTAVFERLAAPS